MGQRTPLYERHLAAGAKMVDFAGWDMPIHYGSQLQEHHQVRRDAGMFDVSHMAVVDVRGPDAQAFLRRLLANDVARLQAPGRALYSCMLNDQGGVIDDLIVYCMSESWYRLVVNAGTRVKDIRWMGQQVGEAQVILEERTDLAMIAVQGPNARAKATPLLPDDLQSPVQALKRFQAVANQEWFVGRTGYTGEDGFEVVLPADQAQEFWDRLQAAGVGPTGLGARDTLRLEAGMNLYGSDMDEQTSPLAAGLGWTLAWEPETRAFIGREALTAQRQAGDLPRFVGLVLLGRGVLRDHMRVRTEDGLGEITSGGFAPTLNRAIAFARIPAGTTTECEVELRGKWVPARIVRPPFVREGQAQIDLS